MEKAPIRFEAAIQSLKSDMDTKLNALNSKFNYLLTLIISLGAVGTLLGGLVALLKLMG